MNEEEIKQKTTENLTRVVVGIEEAIGNESEINMRGIFDMLDTGVLLHEDRAPEDLPGIYLEVQDFRMNQAKAEEGATSMAPKEALATLYRIIADKYFP